MTPAPHTRVDGSITRPVLSLGRMLERVHEPPIEPWGWLYRQRFLATLRQDEQFRRDVRSILEWEDEA